MESLRFDRRPELRRPALICSFRGWNDAAESASSALRFLATQWEAEEFGAIEPEEFYDFQVTRPTAKRAPPEQLGFPQTRYEGATGIVGVLHDACARAGLVSASLWAPVPHYVASVPSPKASLALIRQVERLLEVNVDLSGLEEA